MLAMLRKDVYVMGRYAAALTGSCIVMTLVFSRFLAADVHFPYYLLPALSVMIGPNAVSADQECRWDRFAAMTPLRPWLLVLEKYCFAYGTVALLAGVSALVCRVSATEEDASNMRMMFLLILLSLAISLPLVYRFGRQKSSIILLAFWGLIMAAALGDVYFRYGLIKLALGWMADIPAPLLAVSGGGALLALNAGSILLSIRFYTRRQWGWYG